MFLTVIGALTNLQMMMTMMMRESSPVKDRRSTTVLCHATNYVIVVKLYQPYIQFPVTFTYPIGEQLIFRHIVTFFYYCVL